MKGRTKVEKGVSPDHEVIRDWRYSFAILGQRRGCEYMKKGESDHRWAHVQMLVEQVAPAQGVAPRSAAMLSPLLDLGAKSI
jgi:hypothetical protein